MAHRYRRGIASSPDHPEYVPPHYHPKYPRKDPTGAYSVSYFQGQLFICILEDIVTKMGILINVKSAYDVIKLKSDMSKHLAKKYSVAESKLMRATEVLQTLDEDNLDDVMHKLNKLEFDRNYLVDVITTLLIEIYMDHRFKSLVNSVKDIVREEQYRIDIKEEEMKNKVLRRELYKQLRQQRNHIKTVLYDSNITIDTLKNKLEDLDLRESIRARYIANWEQARTEQNSQVLHDRDYSHTSVSEYFKRRSEQEARIHVDVDMLITLQINETLKKVEQWMEKYDADLEDIELKIQLKKIDYQDTKEKCTTLEQTFENHQKEMTDWISFKEERERLRVYREEMTKSAIIVQAWWRGLLVRRMLGPYRVRKGKKAPQKK